MTRLTLACLLAFTLRAMWDRYHEHRGFDVRGYEALGGLQGAIAQVADDTMAAAMAENGGVTERDLRIAFLGLARPAAEGSGWARQPASWDAMPERVRPVMHARNRHCHGRRREGALVGNRALLPCSRWGRSNGLRRR